jgi:UDP-N-acetylmuramate: L-alanyl-gamma-D-glutamyl-meso-diaminopimelate ligase
VPASGRLVVNGAEPALERVLARGCWSERVRFGSDDGWHEQGAVESAEATAFEVLDGTAPLGHCRLPLAGRHNRLNALAAAAAAAHVGVGPQEAFEALARFQGVRRRMELRGTVGEIAVIDDFAHHPSAIETTIAGLRARLAPGQRILAVIEPRSNTMKLGAMKALLPQSLAGADLSYCHAGGLEWDATAALAPLGERAWVGHDLARLVERVVADAHPGDRVLVMSNGGFGGIHGRLLEALAAKDAA